MLNKFHENNLIFDIDHFDFYFFYLLLIFGENNQLFLKFSIDVKRQYLKNFSFVFRAINSDGSFRVWPRLYRRM